MPVAARSTPDVATGAPERTQSSVARYGGARVQLDTLVTQSHEAAPTMPYLALVICSPLDVDDDVVGNIEVDVKEVLVTPVRVLNVEDVVVTPEFELDVVMVPGAVVDVVDKVPNADEVEVVGWAVELVLLVVPPPMPTSPMESVGASPAQNSLTIRDVTAPPWNVVIVVTVV